MESAMAVKCEKCGKECKNDLALKIHTGIMHADGRTAKVKAARKPGRKGKFICPKCRRSFKMNMHLARHLSASHGLTGRKARTVRMPKTTPAIREAGVDVRTMSVDTLIALKRQIDARLSGIAEQMRQAKVRI